MASRTIGLGDRESFVPFLERGIAEFVTASAKYLGGLDQAVGLIAAVSRMTTRTITIAEGFMDMSQILQVFHRLVA